MMRRKVARVFAATLTVLLAGCCTRIPVIEEPMACPINLIQLEQRCKVPSALPEDATYGDLVKASLNDRDALRACSVHDTLLADALKACNTSIERLRAKIQEINKKFAEGN